MVALETSRLLINGIQQRFSERRSKRGEIHASIEREGILKAAGVAAAVGRAAHMSPQEGSMLMRRRQGENQEANFEAILGIDDSDPVNFLGRGQQAARAVCRLVSGRKAGTGFLVAPGILLTNNHVIASRDEARDTTAEFDYELDLDDQPRSPIQRFELEPDRLFVTSSAQTGLDFTLVAVASNNRSGAALDSFGYIPLDPRIDKILIGEPAIIIQHPRGEQKRVCLFSAELVDKLDDYLHYMTDTDHGSSGSCVVNRSFQLVALHHASVPSGERRRGHDTVVNEGIRVSSILNALDTGARIEGDGDAALGMLTRPDVVRDGRPQPGLQSRAKLMADLKVRPEALDQLARVEEFQVPIRDIARASLDFGAPVRADISEGRRRPSEEAALRSLPRGGEPPNPNACADGNENGGRRPGYVSASKEQPPLPSIGDMRDEVAGLTSMLRELHGVLSRFFAAPHGDDVEPPRPPQDRGIS